MLTLRGAVLGTLEVGRITVAIRGGDPQVVVQGEDWQRRTDRGMILRRPRHPLPDLPRQLEACLTGTGINASAVGSGLVGLRGDGRYSIDGEPYKPGRTSTQTIRLGPDL